MNKNEVIKQLRANPTFKAALERITDEKERKRISLIAEKMMFNIATSYAPLFSAINDPEVREQVAKETANVFSGSLVNAGST